MEIAPAPPSVRRVALRTAMVFGPGEDGVFAAHARLARLGFGGPLAGGRQYVSWVHAADFAAAVDWIIAHPDLSGPVNVAAPGPVTNAELMRLLRRAYHRPFGLPAARWMLEVGALLLGTEAELIVKSRRVVPGRLLASGFRFRFPDLAPAVTDLVTGGAQDAPTLTPAGAAAR
jgi:NAD dependent epimerase/dehydratase family enzyme